MNKTPSAKIWDASNGMLAHWCPGCRAQHQISATTPGQSGHDWTWNWDFNSPTFANLIEIGNYCRYQIRNGMIHFEPNCTHTLKGQVVEMQPLPDWAVPAAPFVRRNR